jgi:hypothetical protein
MADTFLNILVEVISQEKRCCQDCGGLRIGVRVLIPPAFDICTGGSGLAHELSHEAFSSFFLSQNANEGVK